MNQKSMQSLKSGQTIAHYTILGLLGEGSMGQVYKAQDNRLQRTVALKFLARTDLPAESVGTRFLQEAQTASKINHPNVCTVYTIEIESTPPFIAMEFVEGKTLTTVIDQINKSRELLTISRLLSYGRQIAEGVAAAHHCGIVHRDIKAENVMLDLDGRIRIMDFGLAREDASASKTTTRSLLGTIGYIAPEVLLGEEPDRRSDIFSAGVLLYELLTGVLPFRGKHESAMIYAVLNEEPIPFERYRDDIPTGLADLIRQMLAKAPKNRPASIAEVVERIADVARHHSKDSSPPVAAPVMLENLHPRDRLQSLSFRRPYSGRFAERGTFGSGTAPTTRELRLFISSTQHDLQEERDHLVRRVFPEIRALCRERGINFTEVDLRWDESGEEKIGEIIRASLDEIDYCRPWFLSILGDDYGPVPDYLEVQRDQDLLRAHPWVEEALLDRMSLLDMEISYGVLGDVAPSGRALFYGRTSRRSRESVKDPGEGVQKMGELRERIEEAGHSIVPYREPASLGEKVYDDLLDIIERDFAHALPPTPLQMERARHEAFSLSRRTSYIPLPDHLDRLDAHLFSEDPPLVLHAESGYGKSSLLAYWADRLRRKAQDGGVHVVEHYVGIGGSSLDYFSIIRHICMEVKERFDRTEEVPSDPALLTHAFGTWLGYAERELTKRGEKMVVILDGVNQIEGAGRALRWIPEELAPSIRLILSTAEEEMREALQRRGWSEMSVAGLSGEEREAIILRYLSTFHKSLTNEQVTQIAGDEKTYRPLFLKTLLEELRLTRRPEMMQQNIDRLLASGSTEELFQLMLERMEDDYSPFSVGTLLTLVALSHNGLEEREISTMSGLSRLKIASMVASLDFHLVRREGRLTFFHDFLRHAVEERYLSNVEKTGASIERIIDFFEAETLNERTALELLHGYRESGEETRLADYLARIPTLLLLATGDRRTELLAVWDQLRRGGIDIVERVCAGLREYRSVAESPQVFYRALSSVGRLLENLGYWKEAEEIVEQMLQLAEELNHDEWIGYSENVLSMICRNRGAFREAVDHAERSEKMMLGAEYPHGVAKALLSRGRALQDLGETSEMMESFERALEIWEETGDRFGLASVTGNLATAYSNQGLRDRALEMYSTAVTLFEEIGYWSDATMNSANIGIIYAEQGKFDAALEIFEKTLQTYRRLGERSGISNSLEYLANVHMELGSYEEAIASYTTALEMYTELGDRQGVALVHGNLGNLYTRIGNDAEALEALREALAISREIEDRDGIAWSLGELGLYHAMHGEFEKSYEHYRQAYQIHEEIGKVVPLCRWSEGMARALLGIAIERESMPEGLFAELADPTGEIPEIEWRAAVRQRAREQAEGMSKIASEVNDAGFARTSFLLLAHLRALETGSTDELQDVLSGVRNGDGGSPKAQDEEADLLFALWSVGREEEYRVEALEALRQICEENGEGPHAHRRKILEQS